MVAAVVVVADDVVVVVVGDAAGAAERRCLMIAVPIAMIESLRYVNYFARRPVYRRWLILARLADI